MRAAKTRQKLAKKRSLYVINEHFEQVFNEVFAIVIAMQRYPVLHFSILPSTPNPALYQLFTKLGLA
jgi:hypothetical protein